VIEDRAEPAACDRIQPMASEENPHSAEVAANPFTAADVSASLREHGWLTGEASQQQTAWCEHAAELLGPHAADRGKLAELLSLVFHYDAAELMGEIETHVTMSRYAARDVLRQLARLTLDARPFTSDRFKEIVTELKEKLEIRGRELFHPLRLALAGRVGEGELDRVILLVDEAAATGFAVKVKTVRERALEFCAALD
jgi:glutamyl/glutaminyl-tRNA synthetase